MTKWEYYADQIRTLSGRLGFAESTLDFLAYCVELKSGRVLNRLKGKYVAKPEMFYILLSHYAKAEPVYKTGKLIRFRDLPGGYAYEGAFIKRVAFPIAEVFGSKPDELTKAAKFLNGIEAKFGDASVEIPALPKVPITYIVWKGDVELSPSCTVLFDASASHYLPTEDIAVLGEVTTMQLKTYLEQATAESEPRPLKAQMSYK